MQDSFAHADTKVALMSLACTDMVSESHHDMMDKIMSEIVHHIRKLLIVKSETLVI